MKISFFLPLLLPLAAVSFAQRDGDLTEIYINKRPTREFGEKLRKQIESDEIDIGADFKIKFKGSLLPSGRYEFDTTQPMTSEGNVQLVMVAINAVNALNESGYFVYLKDLGVTDASLSIGQNSSDFIMSFDSDIGLISRARNSRSALELMIRIAKARMEKENFTESDKQTARLLEAISVSDDNTYLRIVFQMPKSEFHTILRESL